MPKARCQQVSLEATAYYHCVSRCVRRAFLCGYDAYTGNDYEHRRKWLEERLLGLQSVFCIDVCAFAIMHNHYHVVLHVDIGRAKALSDHDVVERWHSLFKGSLLTERFQAADETLTVAELEAISLRVNEWRERLSDISWYMRCCNEWLARGANKEDNCTGRFWEGRFKSQALLDEKALVACMAYVDLNPVRAKISKTPEASAFTSAKIRFKAAKKAISEMKSPNQRRHQPGSLLPFSGNPRKDLTLGLPFRLSDYLELVDWTGRQIRQNKRGAISNDVPPLLRRLGVRPEVWLVSATRFESRFKTLAGALEVLKSKLHCFELKRIYSAELI